MESSRDGGAYTTVFNGNATSTVVSLQGGHSCRFRATATHLAGNMSPPQLAWMTTRGSTHGDAGTSASLALRAGVATKVVSDRLGDDSVRMCALCRTFDPDQDEPRPREA